MKKIETVGEGVPYDLHSVKLKVNEIVFLLNSQLREIPDNKAEQFTKEELEYIRMELEYLAESFPTVMSYEYRILNKSIREKIGRLLNYKED